MAKGTQRTLSNDLRKIYDEYACSSQTSKQTAIPASFLEPSESNPRFDVSIGVYGMTPLAGRGPPDTVLYEVLLCDTRDEDVSLPRLIPGSRASQDGHDLQRHESMGVQLRDGDILVRSSPTAFENSGHRNAGFMMIRLTWSQSEDESH